MSKNYTWTDKTQITLENLKTCQNFVHTFRVLWKHETKMINVSLSFSSFLVFRLGMFLRCSYFLARFQPKCSYKLGSNKKKNVYVGSRKPENWLQNRGRSVLKTGLNRFAPFLWKWFPVKKLSFLATRAPILKPVQIGSNR